MIETTPSTSLWRLSGDLDFAGFRSGAGAGDSGGSHVVDTYAGSGAQVFDHDLSNRFG